MSDSVILLTSHVNDNTVEYFSSLQVVEITPFSLSNEYRREARGRLDSDSFVGYLFLLAVCRFIELSLDIKEVYQDRCECLFHFFGIACKYAFSICSLKFSTQKRLIIMIVMFLACAVLSLEDSLYTPVGARFCPGLICFFSLPSKFWGSF